MCVECLGTPDTALNDTAKTEAHYDKHHCAQTIGQTEWNRFITCSITQAELHINWRSSWSLCSNIFLSFRWGRIFNLISDYAENCYTGYHQISCHNCRRQHRPKNIRITNGGEKPHCKLQSEFYYTYAPAVAFINVCLLLTAKIMRNWKSKYVANSVTTNQKKSQQNSVLTPQYQPLTNDEMAQIDVQHLLATTRKQVVSVGRPSSSI